MKISSKSVATLLIIIIISLSNVFAEDIDDKVAENENDSSPTEDKTMNLYKKMIARRREV